MRELEKNLLGETLIDRASVMAAGGSDAMIGVRVENGWWTPLHAGVYRIGPPSGEWLERLRAALLACGPHALISHRAAFVLWGLDGIDTRMVEVTVPYANRPIPAGVIRHRTRRRMPAATIRGLPVTTVERTLLDVAPQIPGRVLSKAMDSALRLALTDPVAIARVIYEQGGPGVRGVRRLEQVLSDLELTGPTGSPAETELLDAIRVSGLPMPVLQWEVVAPSGRRYRVDFGWPDRGKGVEVDGLDAHSGSDRLDQDLARQNDLFDAGVELRRFTARSVRTDIDGVLAAIRHFLAD